MASMLEFRLAAPPDTVIAAIRARAGYWQESLVPEELRRRGLRGVDVQIAGDGFRLAGHDLGRDPPALAYVLEGTVVPEMPNGSRVRARVVLAADQARAPVALLGFGMLIGLWGHWLIGAAFLGVGGLVWHFDQQRIARASAGADPGAAHLVARLQLSLAAASAGSPTSTG